VEIVEQVTQRPIPKRILPRRDGDLSEFFADTDLANRLLSWKSSIPITESIQTAWNYKIFSTKIMTTPLVSIVLPTYNPRKDWIIQSIGSVLSQTYQNFELIILDDCSTNSTLSEISELLKSDPRIILIRNEKNMKLTRTLNH
jgi:cellulose synthase/poly-beta-1,6-N-acetylglucosamine synthase-like glycosyltransferase